MLSAYLHGFSTDILAFSHSPKTCILVYWRYYMCVCVYCVTGWSSVQMFNVFAQCLNHQETKWDLALVTQNK